MQNNDFEFLDYLPSYLNGILNYLEHFTMVKLDTWSTSREVTHPQSAPSPARLTSSSVDSSFHQGS